MKVPIVVNTDLIPRTWKPATDSARYEAECHPFIEVGHLPRREYDELVRNSTEDGDGWMTETGPRA